PAVLSRDRRVQVVATALDGETALRKLDRFRPDVVTLDLEMPRMHGLEVLREMVARYATPVLVISAHTGRNAALSAPALEMGGGAGKGGGGGREQGGKRGGGPGSDDPGAGRQAARRGRPALAAARAAAPRRRHAPAAARAAWPQQPHRRDRRLHRRSGGAGLC